MLQSVKQNRQQGLRVAALTYALDPQLLTIQDFGRIMHMVIPDVMQSSVHCTDKTSWLCTAVFARAVKPCGIEHHAEKLLQSIQALVQGNVCSQLPCLNTEQKAADCTWTLDLTRKQPKGQLTRLVGGLSKHSLTENSTRLPNYTLTSRTAQTARPRLQHGTHSPATYLKIDQAKNNYVLAAVSTNERCIIRLLIPLFICTQ